MDRLKRLAVALLERLDRSGYSWVVVTTFARLFGPETAETEYDRAG